MSRQADNAVGAHVMERNHILALSGPRYRERVARYASAHSMRVGDVLQRERAPLEYVFFPCSGVVANSLVTPDDGEVTTQLIGCEGALYCALDGVRTVASVRSTVRVQGMAWRIPFASWHEVTTDPRVREIIAACNALSACETEHTAACNLLHDVESRFCRWLLNIHDRLGGSAIVMTHAELARLTGIRRTSVTQIFGALQRAEIVTNRRGAIDVADRFALEAAACDCYAATRRERDRLTTLFEPPPEAASDTSADHRSTYS